MATSVDIAGAVAPAASLPPARGETRAEGAPRSAHGSRAAKSHSGSKASESKGRAEAFDVQLDAALPSGDAVPTANAGKTGAGKTAAPPFVDADEAGDAGASEQTPVGVVLTPWMFLAPPDSTPAAGGAADGVAPVATESVATTTDASSVPGMPGGASVNGLPAGSEAADGTQVQAIPASTGEAPAPGTGSTAVEAEATALTTHAQSDAQMSGSSPVQAASADSPASTPASAASAASASGDQSSPASASPPSSGDTRQSGATAAATVSATRAPSAQAPLAEPCADGRAHTTPATSLPDGRADAAGVEGRAGTRRSSAAPSRHGQGPQTPAARESDKDRATSWIEATTNVGSADDERRDVPFDDDAMKAMPAAAGSAAAAHEASPLVARVAQPVSPAMPAVDGGRQLAGDAPQVAETPAPAGHVPDPDTPHRLVQALRMQFLRGGGEAVVQLRPEHLGPVTVSLRVEQGSVAAHITAADPVVAEWLRSHQDSLHEGLQANGLTLERLSIDRDGRSPDRRDRREAPPRQRFRPSSEAESTFELTI